MRSINILPIGLLVFTTLVFACLAAALPCSTLKDVCVMLAIWSGFIAVRKIVRFPSPRRTPTPYGAITHRH